MEGVVGGVYGSIAILALGLLGFLASLGTFVEFRRALGSPLCRPGSKVDCLRVYSLPQAWVLGFHLSQLALPFYSLVVILEIVALALNSIPAFRLALLLLLVSAITAPYLIYLMVRYAKAFCIYCLTMHATSILTLILAYEALIRIFLE